LVAKDRVMTAGHENHRLKSDGFAWSLAELVVVFMLFAAAGAWPTPDVNEAHYLTRARHDVEPSWGANDFFLDSPEAHGLFTAVMGPLAAALPLAQAAWIGRILGWMALALGFVHAARATLGSIGSRILAAAVFSLALRHTTAAGEWMIGGCEAKVFAWAGVLWAAGEIARDRWAAAWVTLGAATAVHPLVGGWGLIALVIERLVFERRLRMPAMPLVAGAALALVGLWPAAMLSYGADPAVRAEATRIYVTERLPHHLLPRAFADGMIARHGLAVVVSWLIAKHLPENAARRRLHGFTLAALAISLAGYAISCMEAVHADVAYGLLKFYWFRLSDGLAPLALAIGAATILAEARVLERVFGSAAAVRWVAVLLLAIDLGNESRHWPLPGRNVVPRADKFMQADAWRDICGWVAGNTPDDACFVVPRRAGSFVWRTGRAELVTWKNIPQAPTAIIEWRQRLLECFSRDGAMKNLETDAAALGRDHLLAVANKYAADHAIVAADAPGLDGPGMTRLHANDHYAVYRIDR
jgi:hypothetical protein